jgi:hypothetical protein
MAHRPAEKAKANSRSGGLLIPLNVKHSQSNKYAKKSAGREIEFPVGG